MDTNSRPPSYYTYRSSLAKETHEMKLPAESFPADFNARGGLELCGFLNTSGLSTAPLCNFMWSAILGLLLWFLNDTTVQ